MSNRALLIGGGLAALAAVGLAIAASRRGRAQDGTPPHSESRPTSPAPRAPRQTAQRVAPPARRQAAAPPATSAPQTAQAAQQAWVDDFLATPDGGCPGGVCPVAQARQATIPHALALQIALRTLAETTQREGSVNVARIRPLVAASPTILNRLAAGDLREWNRVLELAQRGVAVTGGSGLFREVGLGNGAWLRRDEDGNFFLFLEA